MKRSLIWTTAGIDVIGLAAPVFAARGDEPRPEVPTSVSVAMTTPTSPTSAPGNSVDSVTNNSVTVNSTANSVEDVSGPCDEAEHANDPSCTGAQSSNSTTDDSTDDSTENSTDDSRNNSIDDSTSNSIDDSTDNSTENSVEDVSGPCDEAEHANDPRCTGAGSNDDSGHSGGNDDSGHGGSDD
jgi:hypothetical protein